MRRIPSSILTISLAAGILVVGGIEVTVAATGGTFLLGKSNSASSTTSLTNSQGTALSLTSKSGSAPLKVSNSTKVTNLNTDKLDGLDSTQLQRRAVGSCPLGISSVGSSGAVTCSRDTLVFGAGVWPYTVPAGIHLLHIRMWGGGGGGYHASPAGAPHPNSGPGGGQGGYLEFLLSVSPGDALTISVGGGGAGQSFDDMMTVAEPGGNSTVSLQSTEVAVASGGQPGYQAMYPDCSSSGGGGNGGAAGTILVGAVGLAAAPGAKGGDGHADCSGGMMPYPGGIGGGFTFVGAGGEGTDSNSTADATGGDDGKVILELG